MIGGILIAAVLVAFGAEAEMCLDGVCPLPPSVFGSPASAITVVSPVPEAAVKPVAQGARLASLDGKTIALVGGSFMANVTHPELKRLILADYPTAKVYLLSEIGSAGPYPRPGVTRREKDEFQRRLREFKIDAVVSGNGGCGLCTPKEAGSCVAAEMLGIPSVMIAAPGFVKQAKSSAASAGIATLRVAEYPGAFASHTREELLANTRAVLWPQIVKALTTPLEASSPAEVSTTNETFETLEEFQRVFEDSGFTDGLPVLPPTPAAVAEFLMFTDLAPDAPLGAIPPAQRAVTPRHVAANGVMAGCPPEYMPLLLAFTEAMKDGDFRRPLASTHGWTPYCWLNGPVARQLGFDSAQGEICERANARLGRFINLALINLGGYRVKENRMGTFGYLMPWCLAEDDAAAVRLGWKPYQMQCGFDLNDSTLTAGSAINWGNNLVPATSDAERIKDMIAWDATEKSQMAVGSGMPLVHRAFLLTESVARDLAAKYSTKDALERALVETARVPLASRAFANYWGNPGSAFDPARYSVARHEDRLADAEHARETVTPPWLVWTGLKQMETLPAMEAGRNAFIVTGDPARNKELCLPGGAFKTVKIVLPKDWDKLMAARGHAPLDSFKLKSDLTPDTPRVQPRYRPRPGARGDLRRR